MNSATLIRIIAIGFIIGTTCLAIDNYNTGKSYSDLVLEESLKGKVMDVLKERGIARVTMNDGKKVTLPFARNSNYQISELSNLVRRGDSLIKNEGSDTITVMRYDRVYIFVINKEVKEGE